MPLVATISFGRRTATLAIAVLAGIACVSCSEEPEPSGAATVSSYEQLRGEVDSLSQPEEEVFLVIQDRISECMREQGFDYVAWVDPELMGTSQPETSETPVVDSVQEAFWGSDSGGSTDPNEAIIAELEQKDPQAANAYFEALWGTEGQLSVELSEDEVDSVDLSVSSLGCWNYSANQVTGGRERLRHTSWLTDASAEIDQLVRSDERYIEVVGQFESCLIVSEFQTAQDAFDAEMTVLRSFGAGPDKRTLADVMPQLESARDTEVKVSMIENECAEESNLYETYDRLASEHFKHVFG